MKINVEQLLIKEAPDALVLLTLDGKIVHWNNGAKAIFGFSSDEVIGYSLNEMIVPSPQRDEENRIFQETIDTGYTTYESIRHKRDGSLVYVDISNKVIRNA